MNAKDLYNRLKNDFIKEYITDIDWAAKMPGLSKYLHTDFKRSGIGLMCDFADRVERVYTTVFLSDQVLAKVLADNTSNAMIFSHHPTNWDIERHGGNYAPTEKYIVALRDRSISVYILHHPLDHYGEYSTNKTLADSIGITIERPGFLYYGALCGLVGTVNSKSVGELHARFSAAMGHRTSLYTYGIEDLQGERIALCAGGGNALFVLNEMVRDNIKTLITGVTIANDYSKEAHALAKKHGINVLGGTHYSSEKFAPMKMREYFNDLGLPAEFIIDAPSLSDL